MVDGGALWLKELLSELNWSHFIYFFLRIFKNFRQDVDGIHGKTSFQLEVCRQGAGEELEEMWQGNLIRNWFSFEIGKELLYPTCLCSVEDFINELNWRMIQEQCLQEKDFSFKTLLSSLTWPKAMSQVKIVPGHFYVCTVYSVHPCFRKRRRKSWNWRKQ